MNARVHLRLPSRRAAIRYLLGAGLVFAGWLMVGYLVLPQSVRSAYAGESFEILNQIISGRGQHDVQRYLLVARGLADRVTFLLGAGAVLLPALWCARPTLDRWFAALTRKGPAGSAGELLLVAVWIGLVGGFVEATSAWARFRLAGLLSSYNNPDVLWMAPLALAGLLGIVACVFALALGRRGRAVSHRIVVGVCGFLAFYSVIHGLELSRYPFGMGLHPLAVAVLALGVAVQLVRGVEANERARRFMRASAIPMALVFVAAPLITAGVDRALEARRAAALPPAQGEPDILLIVLDTVRKESLGLHGYARPNTPVLTSLADSAIVFERAIATSSWTLPTHGSLFTGRFPYELSTDRQQPLDDRHPTLAEFLSERGYATGGFVANMGYTTRLSGLDRGFGRYEDHRRTLGTLVSSAWITREIGATIWGWLPTRYETFDRKYAPLVVNEFDDWLDRVGDRPFFAFLNMYDAHAPYEIHEEFLETFPADPPIDEVRLADGTVEPPSREISRAIDGYDTGIALMDRAIGDLLERLDARGRTESTVVIVTSDHGEHLGDHGLVGHHASLYAQVLLVPLMVHLPGRPADGRRVEAPVSLRDFPATVVDLIGLPVGPFPGRSLARFWEGGADISSGQEPVLSELSASGSLGEDAPHLPISRGPMKSLVEGSLHYILNGDGTEELYDLSVDPHEESDLSDTDLAGRLIPRLRGRLELIAHADTLVYSDKYVRAGR